jgi:hypothetical protein
LWKAKRPLALLAAGYGEVASRASHQSTNSAFGEALAAALEGAADQDPIGNCDGVVTDEEAARYVSEKLRAAELDVDERRAWPMPVFKHNVDYPIPLSRHAAPVGCSIDASAIAQLPQPLRESEGAYRLFLRDQRDIGDLQRRFVLVGGNQLADSVRMDYIARLAELGSRLGWQVVDARDLDEQSIRQASRATTFIDILAVRFDNSAFGGLFAELTRPRDESVLWAERWPSAPSPARARIGAEAMARRLPRSFTLLSVDSAWIVRAIGPIPSRPLSAVSWTDFIRQATPMGHPIALDNLPSVACPGLVGQCFSLGDDHIQEDHEQWVILSQ